MTEGQNLHLSNLIKHCVGIRLCHIVKGARRKNKILERMFNPLTVQFKRIPCVNNECYYLTEGLSWHIIFQSPIEDNFGFRKRSGESGTPLDPGSRTSRQANYLGENLRSPHCLFFVEYYPRNACRYKDLKQSLK